MKTFEQLLTDFRKAKSSVEKLKKDLPRIMGNESVRIVKDNFRLQGYDSGTGVQPWKHRKESTNKSYDRRSGVKGSVYNSSSPILMQTRNLYNAIKYQITSNKVEIGVDLTLVPYGQKMNEGGKGVGWNGSVTHTPARKYIPTEAEGPNLKMLKSFEKKVNFEVNKALSLFTQKQ